MAANLDETKKEVDQIADNLSMPVDEAIKPLVIALRYSGFPTTGSCEGHLEHGQAFPWVDIGMSDEAANRPIRAKMRELLHEFNKNRPPKYRLRMANLGIFGDFRLQSFPGIDYRGGAKTADELKKLRQEADAFAQYVLGSESSRT